MRYAKNGNPIPRVGDVVNCYSNMHCVLVDRIHCTICVHEVDDSDLSNVFIRGTDVKGHDRRFIFGTGCHVRIICTEYENDDEEERNEL